MVVKKDAKRHVHKVKLSDFKAEKADEGAIEIEDDNGEIYHIDPPELWSDDITALNDADDNIGVARALIGGDDQYEKFVAAGGSAMLLLSIIGDTHGVSVGESKASKGS